MDPLDTCLETLELEEVDGVWRLKKLYMEEEELDELALLDSSSPDSRTIKFSGGNSGLGMRLGVGSRSPARK